jgi:hypothetical protein
MPRLHRRHAHSAGNLHQEVRPITGVAVNRSTGCCLTHLRKKEAPPRRAIPSGTGRSGGTGGSPGSTGPGEEPKLYAWTVVRIAYIFQRTPSANVLSNAR